MSDIKDFLKLVQEDYTNIRDVPYQVLKNNPKIINTALGKSCHAIELIPPRLRTEEMIQKAVNMRNEDDCYDLSRVPTSKLTYEICMKAVKRDPNQIKLIPNKFKDVKMCLAVVKKDPELIVFFPKSIQVEDPKIAKTVLKQNPNLLEFISTKLKTPELCAYAFLHSNDGSYEIGGYIFNYDFGVLDFVPNKVLTNFKFYELLHKSEKNIFKLPDTTGLKFYRHWDPKSFDNVLSEEEMRKWQIID